jgi:hypothetical protein
MAAEWVIVDDESRNAEVPRRSGHLYTAREVLISYCKDLGRKFPPILSRPSAKHSSYVSNGPRCVKSCSGQDCCVPNMESLRGKSISGPSRNVMLGCCCPSRTSDDPGRPKFSRSSCQSTLPSFVHVRKSVGLF